MATDSSISHKECQFHSVLSDKTSHNISDSAPCSPGGWTLPIPTSKVGLPFSCPFQHKGHVTGPGQDLLQLSTECLNRVKLSVQGLDLL